MPQMSIKFKGIQIEINEYFRKCSSAGNPEHWCSIITVSKALKDNEIILG